MVILWCPRNKRSVAKILFTNFGPFLDKAYVGMSYGATQWSRNIAAICDAVSLPMGTAGVSLKYLPDMNTTGWLPLAVP